MPSSLVNEKGTLNNFLTAYHSNYEWDKEGIPLANLQNLVQEEGSMSDIQKMADEMHRDFYDDVDRGEYDKAWGLTDFQKEQPNWAQRIGSRMIKRGVDLGAGAIEALAQVSSVAAEGAARSQASMMLPAPGQTTEEFQEFQQKFTGPDALRAEDYYKENPLAKVAEIVRGVTPKHSDKGAGPEQTWEEWKQNKWRLDKLGKFALETGLISAPDMAAAVTMLPAYMGARSGEIAANRAEADDRKDEVSMEDFLIAVPAAAAVSIMERIGASGMFGLQDQAKDFTQREVLKLAGKAAAQEGITEGIQEPLEQVFTQAGTESWGSHSIGEIVAELAEASAQGALAGGIYGGAVRGLVAEGQILGNQGQREPTGGDIVREAVREEIEGIGETQAEEAAPDTPPPTEDVETTAPETTEAPAETTPTETAAAEEAAPAETPSPAGYTELNNGDIVTTENAAGNTVRAMVVKHPAENGNPGYIEIQEIDGNNEVIPASEGGHTANWPAVRSPNDPTPPPNVVKEPTAEEQQAAEEERQQLEAQEAERREQEEALKAEKELREKRMKRAIDKFDGATGEAESENAVADLRKIKNSKEWDQYTDEEQDKIDSIIDQWDQRKIDIAKPQEDADTPPVSETPTEKKTEPEVEDQSPTDAAPFSKMVDSVSGLINERIESGKGGKPMDNIELAKLADAAWGGSVGDGAYDPRQMYNAMETAVNQQIFQSAKAVSESNNENVVAEQLDRIKAIGDSLPRQTRRTKEQVNLQQFSTPPAYAYLAAWGANIEQGMTVLEPSAGTGSLASAALGFAGKNKVSANELSADRMEGLSHLGLKPTQHDATMLTDLETKYEGKFDRVLMNPPFSASHKTSKKQVGTTMRRHVSAALKALKPGGRAIIIGPDSFSQERPGAAGFFKRISPWATLVAEVPVSGKLYERYGTSFGTRVVVLDKAPTAEGYNYKKFKVAENEQELRDFMGEIRAIPIQETTEAESNVQDKTTDDARPLPPAGDREAGTDLDSNEVRGGKLQGGEKEGGAVATEPGESAPGDTGLAVGGRTVDDTPGQRNENRGDDGTTDDSVLRPGVHQAGAGGDISGGTGGVATESGEVQERGGGKQRRPAGSAARDGVGDGVIPLEEDDNSFSVHKPSKVVGNSKPHPGYLVESKNLASVVAPTINEVPQIAPEVIESGAVSDIQLEVVGLAIQSFQKFVDDGVRQGFLIGDGTGVGKAREIAAIMADTWARGQRRFLWVTVSKDLDKSIEENLQAVGLGDVPLIKATSSAQWRKIKGNGIVFTTYSQLRSQPTKDTQWLSDEYGLKDNTEPSGHRIKLLQHWFNNGTDGGGVFTFDESHKLNNSGLGTKRKASQIALAGMRLVDALPNARVVYASATGATTENDIGYMSRLGLWGPKKSFGSAEGLAHFLSKTGTAGKEILASEMKQTGVYRALNLSYKGVQYNNRMHPSSKAEKELMDQASEVWEKVYYAMFDAQRRNTGDQDAVKTDDFKKRSTAFFGAHSQFFNQFQASIKMPTAIKQAEEELGKGNSVVFMLSNTGEASLKRALDQAAPDEKLESIDVTPRGNLLKFINEYFPIHNLEEVDVEIEGEIITELRSVRDSKGNPVINQDSLKQRQKLIDQVNTIHFRDWPIDQIMDRFGNDAVAEVTGRSIRRVKQDDGSYKIEKISPLSRKREMLAFHDGEKRIVVLSAAGGTGFDFHSGNNFANKQKRIGIIVQTPWSAKDMMQMFGRIHRTDQAHPPGYTFVMTDLASETRSGAAAAKNLGDLGATTRGQADASGGGEMFGDMNVFDTYGEKAVGVLLDQVEKSGLVIGDGETVANVSSIDLAHQMFLGDERRGGNFRRGRDGHVSVDVKRFLNRTLHLRRDTQNALLELFFDTRNKLIEDAKERGEYVEGVELRENEGAKIVDEREVYRDENTGSHLNLIVFEEKIPPKRISLKNLQKIFKQRYSQPEFDYYEKTSQTSTAAKKNIIAVGEPANLTKFEYAVKKHPVRWVSGDSSPMTEKEFKKQVDMGLIKPLGQKEGEARWQKEYNERVERESVRVNLLSGSLISTFDRVATSQLTVQRVVFDNGRSVVGRIVSGGALQKTLRGLGDKTVRKVNIKPEEIQKSIIDAGNRVILANGARFFRRRVSLEPRVEFEPPQDKKFLYMTGHGAKEGLQTEIIQGRHHFFVPNGSPGVDIIRNLTEDNIPVQIFSNKEVDVSERWMDFTGGSEAKSDTRHHSLTPGEFWDSTLPEEKTALKNYLAEELHRLAPMAVFQPTDMTRTTDGRKITGASFTDEEGKQVISVAMGGGDPLSMEGVMRHEVVHALKRTGLFTQEEWGTLTKNAQAGDWIGKYGIRKRYPGLFDNSGNPRDENARRIAEEEAIAEDYKNWFMRRKAEGRSLIGRLYQRIMRFLGAVADWLRSAGQRPSAIYEDIESGQVGLRDRIQRKRWDEAIGKLVAAHHTIDPAVELKDKLDAGKNLRATHNLNINHLIKQIEKGGMLAPSIAIQGHDKPNLWDDFSDARTTASVVFKSDAIKIATDPVFADDAYTPMMPDIVTDHVEVTHDKKDLVEGILDYLKKMDIPYNNKNIRKDILRVVTGEEFFNKEKTERDKKGYVLRLLHGGSRPTAGELMEMFGDFLKLEKIEDQFVEFLESYVQRKNVGDRIAFLKRYVELDKEGFFPITAQSKAEKQFIPATEDNILLAMGMNTPDRYSGSDGLLREALSDFEDEIIDFEEGRPYDELRSVPALISTIEKLLEDQFSEYSRKDIFHRLNEIENKVERFLEGDKLEAHTGVIKALENLTVKAMEWNLRDRMILSFDGQNFVRNWDGEKVTSKNRKETFDEINRRAAHFAHDDRFKGYAAHGRIDTLEQAREALKKESDREKRDRLLEAKPFRRLELNEWAYILVDKSQEKSLAPYKDALASQGVDVAFTPNVELEQDRKKIVAEAQSRPDVLFHVEPETEYKGFKEGSEERFQEASKRITPTDIGVIKKSLTDFWHSMTREYPSMTEGWEFGRRKGKAKEDATYFAEVREAMYGLQHAAQGQVERVARNYSKVFPVDAPPEEHQLLIRKMLLQDLSYEADQGRKMPFGYEDKTQVMTDLREVEEEMDKHGSVIWDRYNKHNKFNQQLRKEAISAGVFSHEQAANTNYFSHKVLEYRMLKKMGFNEAAAKVSRAQRHRRKGSEKDIYTNPEVVAEWQVMLVKDIQTAKFLRKLRESKYNIAGNLRNEARKSNQAGIAEWKAKTRAEGNEQDKARLKRLNRISAGMSLNMKSLQARLNDSSRDDVLEVVPGHLHSVLLPFMKGVPTKGPDSSKLFQLIAFLAGARKSGLHPEVIDLGAKTLAMMGARSRLIAQILGDNYANPRHLDELVRRFYPDQGYTIWQPDSRNGEKVNVMFASETIPDYVVDRALTKIESLEADGVTQKDLGELRDMLADNRNTVFSMGGPKEQLVIRGELSQALDDFYDKDLTELLRALSIGTSQWKNWTLFNPARFSKYYLNNMSGDLDALIGAGMIGEVRKELGNAHRLVVSFMKSENEVLPPEVGEVLDMGIMHSSITAQEITNNPSLSVSDFMVPPDKPVNSAMQRMLDKTGKPIRKYFQAVHAIARHRENTARLAAYLVYRRELDPERMNAAGESLDDVLRRMRRGATAEHVISGLSPTAEEHQKNWRALAGRMARDVMGDYGRLPKGIRKARRVFMPFVSFSASNAIRYTNIFANIMFHDAQARGGWDSSKRFASMAGAKTGLMAAWMAAYTFMLYGLVNAWNYLTAGEEEEMLAPHDRVRLHVMLGTWGDTIVSLRAQGALSDYLGWVGAEHAVEAALETDRGTGFNAKKTAVDMLKSPVNKFVSLVGPVHKLPIELAAGQTTWPDLFSRRQINDPVQHASRTFSAAWLTGLVQETIFNQPVPDRGAAKAAASLVVYVTSPGELAYQRTSQRAYQWLRDQGQPSFSGRRVPLTRMYAAYRAAILLGDAEAEAIAQARIKEMLEADGRGREYGSTLRRIRKNLLDPLSTLSRAQRLKFTRELDENGKDDLQKARVWLTKQNRISREEG